MHTVQCAHCTDQILDPTLDPRAPPEPPRADPDLHSLPVPSELSLDVLFLYLFMDLSAKTPTFESISGRGSSNKTLKSRCFKLEVHEHIKKTLHRSEVRAFFAIKTHIKCAIWNSSADPLQSAGSAGSAGSGVSSRCSDPPQHAPEVRMT